MLTENNKRAIDIMNDLFGIIELGESYEAFRLKSVSVKGLIDQILDSYSAEITKKRLKFAVKVPKTLHVQAEEARLLVALVNLIDNAITYSDDGGRIRIEAAQSKGEVHISIEDKGIGIPKDEQIKVFTKFFRAKNSYLKKTVGTGLGLLIAKTIIEGHSGTLDFKSIEGEGSTFRIKLAQKK